MNYFLLLYLILVGGVLSISFNLLYHGYRKLSVIPSLIGFAIAPSFISVVLYGVFVVFAWQPISGAFPYVIFPIGVAFFFLFIVARYQDAPKSMELDQVGKERLFLASVPLCFCLLYVLALLIYQGLSVQTDHDYLVYLVEAQDYARFMLRGGDFGDWASYVSERVKQPHGILYSLYLAMGILIDFDSERGVEEAVRTLVIFNHVAFLSAAIAVLVSCLSHPNLRLTACCICIAGLMSSSVMQYEIKSFSRDTYYIAPFLILVWLFSLPTIIRPSSFGWLFLLFLSCVTLVFGHTLGIILLAAVFAAGVIVRYFEEDGQGVKDVLVVFLALMLGVAYNGIKFFINRSPDAEGFSYRYYLEPTLQKAFEEKRYWLKDISFWEYLEKILGFSSLPLTIFCLAVGLVVVFCIRKKAIGNTAAVLLSLLAALTIPFFVPAKLDGISLAGAYASNPRYSFPIIVLSWILVSAVFISLFERAKDRVAWVTIVPAMIMIVLMYKNTNFLFNTRKGEGYIYSEINKVCSDLDIVEGSGTILMTYDIFQFFCGDRSKYVFTKEGSFALGAESKAESFSRIENSDVSSVIFWRPDVTWKDTVFFQAVREHWRLKSYARGKIQVFVRPEA